MRYEEIVAKTNEVLSEYTGKLTLRQIYYRLVAVLMIENKVSAYNQLSRMLVKARERGVVDYTRIEDRVRRVEGSDGVFDNPNEYFEAVIRSMERQINSYDANRTMWTSQPRYVEVWTEKDALAGVLVDITRLFKVPLCVARGYSSFTFVMDAVKRFKEADDDGKKLIILYFGDFDPSGEDMVRDLRDRITRYSGLDITIRKVALTQELIDEFQLPPAPMKESDTRRASFIAKYGDVGVVELDALPPDELRRIVIDAIENEVDMMIWEGDKQSTEEEAVQVKKKYKRIKELISKDVRR